MKRSRAVGNQAMVFIIEFIHAFRLVIIRSPRWRLKETFNFRDNLHLSLGSTSA